jgi:hypothetical protein
VLRKSDNGVCISGIESSNVVQEALSSPLEPSDLVVSGCLTSNLSTKIDLGTLKCGHNLMLVIYGTIPKSLNVMVL